ncbi:MAG TPA: methylmalonyl-CoA mutase family protein [Thermodesulfobacteriota bacterium]|nr:methylmalonyl-CoA mutase family protein [Thermodesulfobacteriota bacterium]
MFDARKMEELEERQKDWKSACLQKSLDKIKMKAEHFPKQFYTPLDIRDFDHGRDLGFPGDYPFTMATHPTAIPAEFLVGARARYSGFGTPEDTRDHFKFLVSKGFTGPSVAFDLPTQIGYDSDHPLAMGEVGKIGVACGTLRDLEVIFDAFQGLPLENLRTSFTCNAQTVVILAMYVALAEKKGVPLAKLTGTVQNDILKEYIARGTYIFPPGPSLRLVADTLVYGTKFLPRFNVMSISSYHIREAGASATQELGFMFANAIAYIEAGLKAGLQVDDFAPRLSYLGGCGSHFFQEVAKFRAARRIYAKLMKERFGAQDPDSMRLRYPSGNAAHTFTVKKPLNNIVRATVQAMSTLLGGCMGGGFAVPYDEALGLYTERSRKIADDTPRILRMEARLGDMIDPLAGSYYVEYLTNQVEEEVWKILEKIDSLGGAVKAIERGYMQQEIGRNAYQIQQDLERGKRVVVGVNKFVEDEEPIEGGMAPDATVEERQLANLAKIKKERDNQRVRISLDQIRKAAEGKENLMGPVIEAVKLQTTIGEICQVLREIFGEYQPYTQL